MSDPVLFQSTFMLKEDTPEEIKKVILYYFTDYYTKYFPKESPTEGEAFDLLQKYPEIRDICRNDCYHNVEIQTCNISRDDLYDWNDERTDKPIGISIISLPRSYFQVWEFFKLMKPYIYSNVPTLGIATLDYSNDCWIYSMLGKHIYTKKVSITNKAEATLVA